MKQPIRVIQARLLEAFDRAPWRERYPGVYYKEVKLGEHHYRADRFLCPDCHEPVRPDYKEPSCPMVTDLVWTAVGLHKRGVACQGCLEKRLGRPLVKQDLQLTKDGRDLPFNRGWSDLAPMPEEDWKVEVERLRDLLHVRWPLDITPAFPDAPGCFGVFRKMDRHTGVDLYCPIGTRVLAMESGMVVKVEWFTGKKAGSPWWNDTQAVLVEGPSGVIVYGEVSPHVQEGDRVEAGQHIATVDAPVLKKDKGRPMTMLHLELMKTGSRETLWWLLGETQPQNLLDPTDMLLKAAAGEAEFRSRQMPLPTRR